MVSPRCFYDRRSTAPYLGLTDQQSEYNGRPIMIRGAVFIQDFSFFETCTIGHMSPKVSDPTFAGSVIITFEESIIEDYHEGITQSILHDIGHVLGLRLPHEEEERGKSVGDSKQNRCIKYLIWRMSAR